ncbi:LacI family DNA-binding transcriptional regulator [Actinoplanes derwentensis]|uniref:DNA-binding transcriptional regulator, LacI/PurR family n=1 Tax=Actinoplanes derwentensis TaxID=113562 RepID=A0A1H2DDS1_9ACTN|nr:LacI family DNA-binding transcriptional regulator [Actinoplanes derwentensis]GID90137.1 LacI family transcriptional regulator [Actinoplanes derwentensis]SDT80739.1 DNA-binding transcriptional regulator, LacI/PurR family [Actinoplanes derwentensis]
MPQIDPPRRRRVSMADVARLAGVSTQTVSRVSTGYSGVDGSTRRQVLAAMKELGYRPNGAARALKHGEFKTLGVMLGSLADTGSGRILESIAAQAVLAGYAITLIPVQAPTRSGFIGAFTRFDELAVDGIIILMKAQLLDEVGMALPPTLPHVVVVDSDISHRYSTVDSDHAEGVRLAVRHLLKLGHRTVWHVSGPEQSAAAIRRAVAWRSELEAAGQTIPPLLHGDWSARSGYVAGLDLADRPGCTAVLAANDQTALGLLKAFQERGKDVPEQISVVGFDDIPEATSFIPSLTTVRQDFAEVGRLCLQEILHQIRGEGSRRTQTLVPAQLVVRGSTAVSRACGTATSGSPPSASAG